MLFVELGREVSPLNINMRNNKAVITGIKDNKFVVILKQDKTYELVRLRDVVLNDKVYNLDELKNEGHEFFQMDAPQKKSTDFERFVLSLRKRVEDELVKSKIANN